ncbi:MAG: hypothetical protein AAF564_25580 [Bacteroidota bacterium]
MKHSFVFVLIFSFLFVGCQDSNGRFTLRRNSPEAGTEARAAIAQMSPIELDRCPVEIDVPRPTDIAISSTPPTASATTSSDDRSTWQDKLAQVMGDDGAIEDEPLPASRATASVNSNTVGERINRIDIRSRNSSYDRVDIISGNAARLTTRGTARVTREVPDRRGRIETVTNEGVEVNLVYNLINSTRGWTCSSVNADIISIPDGTDSSQSGSRSRSDKDYSNRIGW